MKKWTALLLALVMCFALCACGGKDAAPAGSEAEKVQKEAETSNQDYPEVLSALEGNTWYFNGGSNTILNRITFAGENATIEQVSFDGNGKHDGGSNTYSFKIDDANIVVNVNDLSELSIPYSLSDGAITLGNQDYYTIEEIEAGLQGFWYLDYQDSYSHAQHAIQINNGEIVSESESQSAFSPDEYFYYGPAYDPSYQSTYTMNFGGFDTQMAHGSNWFWNVIDGKVTLLRYDKVCTPTDGLPGENGYTW